MYEIEDVDLSIGAGLSDAATAPDASHVRDVDVWN